MQELESNGRCFEEVKFVESSVMESYMKSWKSMAKLNNRDFPNFLQKRSNEFKMKNSLKPDDDNRDKVDSNESATDSFPIHCIIQTVSSLEDLKSTTCENCDGKSKPNRVNWWECDCKKNEMSGCVVVPEDTFMSDLVHTVLVKLGYPSSASDFAAGSILIRNWKPLPLESVCPEMKKTVADILGELTAVVSLRIQFFRPKISILQKIKDNLLNFLIKSNQNFLKDSGCPFDMDTLCEFCDQNDNTRRHLFQEPSEDLQRKFNIWLKHHQQTEKQQETGKSSSLSSLQLKLPPQNLNGESGLLSESLTKSESGKFMNEAPGEENCVNESTAFTVIERAKIIVAPKTRVRTSFDPEFELPKLHKWFMENPHPSRQQIYEYVSELNSLDSRKGRKQLDVNNVVYWFKNARAAQKRTECRISNGSTAGGNRCNVLKIPLGKTSGTPSDDQRSGSDDEASGTSESGDEFRQDPGRRLQVVGKWNSNGQGEAVLEMQIPSRKNEITQSGVPNKMERMNEDEETSKSGMLSMDEDSLDPVKKNYIYENKNLPLVSSEKSLGQKENQEVNLMGNNKNEISRKLDIVGNNGDTKEDEVSSSKIQIRNFTQFKENNGVNNSFLSSYKSGFPVPPNSILGHSFIYMSQYMNPKPNSSPLSSEERRKRNRTFIDPVTEVPRLEQWFRLSTHPSHNLIARYTDELNNMPYRRKFPKLEAKNVQFWFKNRRAKNKRLNHLENNNNN